MKFVNYFSVFLKAAVFFIIVSAAAADKTALPPNKSTLSTNPGNQLILNRTLVTSNIIHRHLSDSSSGSDLAALQECRGRMELNSDIIRSAGDDLQSANDQRMDAELVGRVQNYLRAMIGNLRTCYDGLVQVQSPILMGQDNQEFVRAMSRADRLYNQAVRSVTSALNINSQSNQQSTPQPPPPPRRPPRPPPSPSPGQRKSLTDIVHGLKKPAGCTTGSRSSKCNRKGKLIFEGMRGNGIVVSDSVIVSKDGTGDFSTIEEALKVAPQNTKADDGYFLIYVKRGVYQEYLHLRRPTNYVLMLGDGINASVITGNHNNAGGWGTSNSATFSVSGEGFLAIDLTFRNTAGPHSQAVAVYNAADCSAFFRCRIEGYQDTLYAHSGKQFYRDCVISGAIDFIFGDAAAIFQNCRIVAGTDRVAATIAAQARAEPDGNTGFNFHNCTIDSDPPSSSLSSSLSSSPSSDSNDDHDHHHHHHRHRHHHQHQDGNGNGNGNRNGNHRSFLGRPWKDCAKTVYMQSYMGSSIDPAGWRPWGGRNELDTLYYGEYDNYGPGSDTSKRVTWPGYKIMNATDAMPFTVQYFIDGPSWLPLTDVPYFEGLL